MSLRSPSTSPTLRALTLYRARIITDLLAQCEQKHRDLFDRLYPRGVNEHTFETAVMQIEATLANMGKAPSPTLLERYDFLCSKLKVKDLDFNEQDGLIGLKEGEVFFSFSTPPSSVDEAVINALQSELS